MPNWNLPLRPAVEAVPETGRTLDGARVSPVHLESEPGLNPARNRNRRSRLSGATGVIEERRSVADVRFRIGIVIGGPAVILRAGVKIDIQFLAVPLQRG